MSIKNIALITGASSGLGKEFVKLMLNEPELEEIWVLARNEQKLNMLKDFSDKIKVFALDLSDLNAILKFQNTLEEQKHQCGQNSHAYLG